MKINKTLLIGIACGIGCAVCVALYIGQVNHDTEVARAEALARYGGEQLEVCVATRTINPGEIIDERAVESKMWLVDFLPADAVVDSSTVIGKRAESAILAGEVVSRLRFEDTGKSLDVPEGLVAVSVPARDVQAVGGALASGMHVNVYATGSSSTELILRDALVLATSITASTTSNASTAWITLAVGPERVQEVVSAAQGLELYFVLPDKAALDFFGGEEAEEIAGSDEGDISPVEDATGNDRDPDGDVHLSDALPPADGDEGNDDLGDAARVPPDSSSDSLVLRSGGGGNHE